jgi:hypothetical protein
MTTVALGNETVTSQTTTSISTPTHVTTSAAILDEDISKVDNSRNKNSIGIKVTSIVAIIMLLLLAVTVVFALHFLRGRKQGQGVVFQKLALRSLDIGNALVSPSAAATKAPELDWEEMWGIERCSPIEPPTTARQMNPAGFTWLQEAADSLVGGGKLAAQSLRSKGPPKEKASDESFEQTHGSSRMPLSSMHGNIKSLQRQPEPIVPSQQSVLHEVTDFRSAIAATRLQVLAARANSSFAARVTGRCQPPSQMFDLGATSSQLFGANPKGEQGLYFRAK